MFSTVYFIILTIYVVFFICITAIIIRRTKQTTEKAKKHCEELKKEITINISHL